MAFRQRFKIDINDSLSDIVRSEFPGIPLYQGNHDSSKSMFFKINKSLDSLTEARRKSSDRSYNVDLQFFVRNFLPRKRNKGLDAAYRHAERLKQLLFSYRNQLISKKNFVTIANNNFILSDGQGFSVRKNQEDLYAYHGLNVNNVNLTVEESKGYFVFNFNIEANIEKIFNS